MASLDPELWFPDENCNVHLYEPGQSRRGPAFRVPVEVLLSTNCQPLLQKCLAQKYRESSSLGLSTEDGSYLNSPSIDLFIPPPPNTARGQVLLYHMATRNFFAWVLRKPLVGIHLGAALVGLLDGMNDYRSLGEDNVQAVMDYMDEQGYADMRNQPENALAILFFAEHFHFKDLWTDAFAHCVGMHESVACLPEYEVFPNY